MGIDGTIAKTIESYEAKRNKVYLMIWRYLSCQLLWKQNARSNSNIMPGAENVSHIAYILHIIIINMLIAIILHIQNETTW